MVEQSGTPYFYGMSEHRINAKGQVAVPARFRSVLPDEELKKGFVLLKGEKECIYCYTHEHFRTIVDRVMGDEETRGDADFLRDFFEQVYAVDVDSQGRVVIASELRQEVGISGEAVVFIGHNDRIEIWDSDARKADRELAKADYQQKRSRLSRRIFGA